MESAKKSASKLKLAAQFFHEIYVADEVSDDTVAAIEQDTGFESENKMIVMNETGDIVMASDLINSLKNQDDDGLYVPVNSLQGNEYSVDEVIASVDEQYVSAVCYSSALQTLSNVDNPNGTVDSSMYMATIPQSVKNARNFDLYANYYAGVMDMQSYNILQKAQVINEIAAAQPTDDLTKFIINFNDTDYSGVSPLLGWVIGVNDAIVTTADVAVAAAKGLLTVFTKLYELLKQAISTVIVKAKRAFLGAIFEKDDGYQNLIDVPAFQIRFNVSELGQEIWDMQHTVMYDPNRNNRLVSALLGNLGLTFNDFLHWLRACGRIEIPLKGVSYFFTISEDLTTILLQVFVGFIQSHGLDDYLSGRNILTYIAYADVNDASSIPLYNGQFGQQSIDVEMTDIENADSCIAGGLAQYNLKTMYDLYNDLNVVEGEYSDNDSDTYQYMYKGIQLAFIYPVILSFCLNYNIGDKVLTYSTEDQATNSIEKTELALDFISADLIGLRTCILLRRQWLVAISPFYYAIVSNRSNLLEGPTFYGNATYPTTRGITYNLIQGLSVSPKSNLTAYSSLNIQLDAAHSQLTNWKNGVTKFVNSFYHMLIRYFVSINDSNNSASNPQVLLPDISNSLHFPSYEFHLCTDADNQRRFNNFMTTIAVGIGVIATTVLVMAVTKKIANVTLITNAKLLNVTQTLPSVSPSSSEYQRLLREGRIMRRRLRRLQNLSGNTGAAVGYVDLNFVNNADSLDKIVKLISG
jgi:hypothetical protein